MTDIQATERRACPYLRPAIAAPSKTLDVAVYCRRPGGHARIPPRDEVIRFCASGHHDRCPGYRPAWVRQAFAMGVA